MIRVAIVVAVVLVGASAPGAVARRGMETCDYTGPQWRLVDGRKGTVWVAEFQRTTCAYARSWARRLALLHTPKEYGVPLRGGPKGWRCQSLAIATKTVLSGSCIKGTKFFTWHPGV